MPAHTCHRVLTLSNRHLPTNCTGTGISSYPGSSSSFKAVWLQVHSTYMYSCRRWPSSYATLLPLTGDALANRSTRELDFGSSVQLVLPLRPPTELTSTLAAEPKNVTAQPSSSCRRVLLPRGHRLTYPQHAVRICRRAIQQQVRAGCVCSAGPHRQDLVGTAADARARRGRCAL